ncbi:glycosyltransferase family 4 protein [Soehngenia saccharolytica]|nr:glycosyltransferase family 4 protein [Soehngenia saccharolytica]
MSKILFVATVDSHIKTFHIPYIKMLKEMGNQVDVASNGEEKIPYTDNKWEISFERSPFKKQNIKAYHDLKKIIKQNNYDLIHCHTPVGGVIARLAAKEYRKDKLKVIYTAHGFHFYKGAPLKNWIIYYSVEKWLSKYTDCLITINEEDYNIAKAKFKAKEVKLVNGVGIDLTKFSPQTTDNKIKLREKYGFNQNDFILFYAGELNSNKHQDFLIEVVGRLKSKIPNIKLLLAGKGIKLNEYKSLVAKMKLNDSIYFLGYRNDINSLLQISDVAVSSSKREGLPVNVMEAMVTGLPLVVTNCRGNRDLVKNGINGYVVDIDDIEGFANSIYKIYSDDTLYRKFSEASLNLIKRYSLENVSKDMEEIYTKYLTGE